MGGDATHLYRHAASTVKQCRAGSLIWLCWLRASNLTVSTLPRLNFFCDKQSPHCRSWILDFCYALFLFSCKKSSMRRKKKKSVQTRFNLRKFWQSSKITGYFFSFFTLQDTRTCTSHNSELGAPNYKFDHFSTYPSAWITGPQPTKVEQFSRGQTTHTLTRLKHVLPYDWSRVDSILQKIAPYLLIIITHLEINMCTVYCVHRQ